MFFVISSALFYYLDPDRALYPLVAPSTPWPNPQPPVYTLDPLAAPWAPWLHPQPLWSRPPGNTLAPGCALGPLAAPSAPVYALDPLMSGCVLSTPTRSSPQFCKPSMSLGLLHPYD